MDKLSFSQGIFIPLLTVWLMNHVETLHWHFWRTAKLSSTAAASAYTPAGSARGFKCLHILANTCYYLLLAKNYPSGYMMHFAFLNFFEGGGQKVNEIVTGMVWLMSVRTPKELWLKIRLISHSYQSVRWVGEWQGEEEIGFQPPRQPHFCYWLSHPFCRKAYGPHGGLSGQGWLIAY